MAHGKIYNWLLDVAFKIVVRSLRIAGWWIDKTTRNGK